MCIFNVFQSIDLSDTVLLSQAQLLLWAVSIVFTYYIFRKQLKLTKDQISLTEWIFKVTQIRYEIDNLHNIILDATNSFNKCHDELLKSKAVINDERRNFLIKQKENDQNTINNANKELSYYLKEYENILNQKHF